MKRQRRNQQSALLIGDKWAQEKDGVSLDADTPHGSRRKRGKEQTRPQGHKSDLRPHRKLGDENFNISRGFALLGLCNFRVLSRGNIAGEESTIDFPFSIAFDGTQEQPSECRICTEPIRNTTGHTRFVLADCELNACYRQSTFFALELTFIT